MPPKKAAKKGPTADDIFDMLVGDGEHLPENIDLYDSKIDGTKVSYVCAEDKKGKIVPIALILTAKTRELLKGLEEIATADRRPENEDDEGDSDDEGEDEPTSFEP